MKKRKNFKRRPKEKTMGLQVKVYNNNIEGEDKKENTLTSLADISLNESNDIIYYNIKTIKSIFIRYYTIKKCNCI